MRLLLVEDDMMIGQVLAQLLGRAHYVVDWAKDGIEADTALCTTAYDLVLLDLGLPRMDGLEVLRRLRAKGNATPVIVATARDAVSDRIAGLDAGADDYVLKPFDFDELLARLRALRRRTKTHLEAGYRYKDVWLDSMARKARLAGVDVQLSAREWAVLEPLLQRPGQVLSRAQLEEKLYGWRDEINSNAVEVYIHGIRRKLGSSIIQNVRGLGYRVPLQEAGES
ncbi:MAG: response regulator transcription factor [Pseudomonadota bacterium]|nr:response regulator transcription factor [Pseudomonadota bacterium]